jgi:hypothetical protein
MPAVDTRGSRVAVGNSPRAPIDGLAVVIWFRDATRITVAVTAAPDESGAEAKAVTLLLESRPAVRSGIRCSIPIDTAAAAMDG